MNKTKASPTRRPQPSFDAALESPADVGDCVVASVREVLVDNPSDTPDNPSETPDNLHAMLPPTPEVVLPIIGLGGSAGGIEALRGFFSGMSVESGMAFVVVMHLSPTHESTLAQILQQQTDMPVTQVTQRTLVEANHVYVIPPNRLLQMDDGHMLLSEMPLKDGKRVAIDLFFRTLADAKGPHATGIILSGADADGAIGLKRIKEHGGLTVAQEPAEAEHDTMPRSAIATGMVDWILPVAQMPEKLLEYRRVEGEIRLPPEATAPLDEESQRLARVRRTTDQLDADEAALRELLSLLRTRTGHDFTHYKRATVLRRIGRRLQVNSLTDIPTYIGFLRTHPGEALALLQDLLISVTNFFRDPESFRVLESAVPRIFEGKKAGDQVRVWVAGCATGEEAYSVAMLLCEYAAKLDSPPRVVVFATDLDDAAVAAAREGIYPETIAADVSSTRLHRFFVEQNGCYRVKKELRELVLFASHNLLKDSPFSRLELVTCRNLLIYLNRQAQVRALELFHFSLNPRGILFLGNSESVGDTDYLFTAVDKKHRLYERRDSARPAPQIDLPVPPMPRLSPFIMRRHTKSETVGTVLPGHRALPVDSGNADSRRPDLSDLHLQLIEQYAPPSIIVDEEYEILHLSENAGRFLQFAGGEPSRNILKVVHPALRLDLRTSLFRVTKKEKAIEARRVPVELDGQAQLIDIRVRPVSKSEAGRALILILFEEVTEEVPALPLPASDESVSRLLEEELQYTKDHLLSSVEQYEATVEELKASNEELQAMNEELRSATEEPETGKEELQSVNEELITVNQELKSNIEELSRTNSDLQNLMASTDIATMFLDRELHIKRYTPRAVQLFNLIPSDANRPIGHITHQLDYEHLAADAERVLDRLTAVEREVTSKDGRTFLARQLPYRSSEDRIDGVVLTFVDISARKEAEATSRVAEERFRMLVEGVRDYAIFILDLDGRITSWNEGVQHLLGYGEAEWIGRHSGMIFTPEDRAIGEDQKEIETTKREGNALDERWHVCKDGTRFFASGVMTLLCDENNQPHALSKILRDETPRKIAEDRLQQSQLELDAALTVGRVGTWRWTLPDEFCILDDACLRVLGLPPSARQIDVPTFIGLVQPEYRQRVEEQIRATLRHREPYDTEAPYLHPATGETRWIHSNGRFISPDGDTLIGAAMDVTERKTAEDELRRAHDELEQRVLERTQELQEANTSLEKEIAERRSLEDARQRLLERLVTVQEEERKRFSRELHDQMGQHLTALLLGLKTVPDGTGHTKAERAVHFERLQNIVSDIMQQVHNLAWELRPAALDNLGLAAALQQYAAEWSDQYSTKLNFVAEQVGPKVRLPAHIEISIYRVVQEALNNVQRHSNAKTVSIVLEKRRGQIIAVIEDDGQGFKAGKVMDSLSSHGSKTDRLGLIGMRERMELIGGSLTVESSSKGTTIYARAPVNRRRHARKET